MLLDLTGVNDLLVSGITALLPTATFILLAEWTIRMMFSFVFGKKVKMVD